MRIDKNTYFSDFLFKVDIFKLNESQLNELFKKLENYKPIMICEKKVPENLNDLTFGQLALLQSIQTVEEMLFNTIKIILDLEKESILNCPAFDIIGFMLFVKKELIRIGKLFQKIKYNPTAEEIQAGINQINSGIFGTIDWYALRMGITHKEAEDTNWVIVYKCLKIDNEKAKFDKKLREVYSKKK